MNKQGTKFVGAAYQYFFIKQMLIFRVIFILNNFFSNYIVTKLMINFYIPFIHYHYKVNFVFMHLLIPYCTIVSNNSIDVIYHAVNCYSAC